MIQLKSLPNTYVMADFLDRKGQQHCSDVCIFADDGWCARNSPALYSGGTVTYDGVPRPAYTGVSDCYLAELDNETEKAWYYILLEDL